MTPPLLRGINLVGMEGGYGGGVAGSDWDRAVGPVAGHDYPAFAPELLSYYRDMGIGVLRLLVSWERLQAELGGPLPGAGAGYAAYFAARQDGDTPAQADKAADAYMKEAFDVAVSR